MIDAQRRPGIGRRLATAAVLSGLTAVAAAAWLVWGPTATRGEVALYRTGESGRSPADPLALGDIGGATENLARVETLDAVEQIHFLTPAELALYRAGDGVRARVAVANFPEGKATVLLVELRDATAAAEADHELVAVQQGFGFTELPLHVPGVDALTYTPRPGDPPDTLPAIRAVYQHGDVVARLEFRGPDLRAATTRFQTVLDAQLRDLAADD